MKELKIVMLGPSLNQQGGMASVQKLISNIHFEGIAIKHISTHDEGRIRHRLKVFLLALWEFMWLLLRGNVDVVHIHIAEKGSVLRKSILILLAWVFHRPVIVHAHGAEFHLFYVKLPLLAKQLLNWVLQRCTLFIALSESWKDFYLTNCGLKAERIVILANPVEFPVIVPDRANSNKINFIFLGRIGQRKGVFDLLRAFANLAPEQKERAVLTIAGDGQIEQARSLVNMLNLTDKVIMPGWLNTSQRNELLSEADVFVLPSYNEGLPMAMLEAMSWGLPVITTPIGGIPEVVTQAETGLLVKPGDIEHLTEAMQSLIENKSLRLFLGSCARKRVAPLDMKNYSNSLLCIYRSVFEDSRQVKTARFNLSNKPVLNRNP